MSNLLYTDVEDSLRESLRSALTKKVDFVELSGLADEPNRELSHLWGAVGSELGLAGLLIAEEFGGAGATAREAAVVAEELGRFVAPVPFLTSSVMATAALSHAGAGDVLAAIAGGEKTAVLVVPWTSRAGAWESSDIIEPVAGAIGADYFIVPVSDGDGTELRLLGGDKVRVEPLTSLDMTRQLARVHVSASGLSLASGHDAVAAVDAGLNAAASLLPSEQVGLAQACLEETLDYVKTRVQFARPIGSFQAIKHRLADVYLEVVQAQAAARYSADTLATGDADAAVARAVAGAYCSDVAVHVAEEALQLHGGIAMTWEHPTHLFLKRAKSNQLALGTPERHRTDLAALVGLEL